MTTLKYRTGEEIRRGDHVLFHGKAAQIEAVATPSFCDPDNPETAWHVREFGGGVLVSDPLVSGHSFIRAESIPDYEDLEFVRRAEPSQS
jgi:hypothetical protein